MLPNPTPTEANKHLPPLSTFHKGTGSVSPFTSPPHYAPIDATGRLISKSS